MNDEDRTEEQELEEQELIFQGCLVSAALAVHAANGSLSVALSLVQAQEQAGEIVDACECADTLLEKINLISSAMDSRDMSYVEETLKDLGH